MEREDFREVAEYHLIAVKKIIEQRGYCCDVHCINCPFAQENTFTSYCGGETDVLIKRCREFIELSKIEITKERKYYSITDLLRRQVRELQKEIGVRVVDVRKIRYMRDQECKEAIKELYRIDFYKTDNWLVRLARRIGG